MGARLYRDKFSCRVYAFKIYGKLPYLGQSFIYKRFSEMPHIKENTPVNTPPALNLLLLCPRHHITAGKFENGGISGAQQPAGARLLLRHAAPPIRFTNQYACG